MRTKFEKGKQREFLDKVLEKTNCPSLRELSRRVIMKNNSLKNYYSERRTLPEILFLDLCKISDLNKKDFNFEILNENWGQVEGGRKSKR